MHIVDMVYFWARSMPRHPAVIQPGGIVTYWALAQGIESAAAYFASNITDRSKPITVSLQSAAKALIASLGLLRSGYSIIVANSPDLTHIAADDSNILVHERDGASLSDRTNIVFDESWLEIGAAAPRQIRPLQQPRLQRAEVLFFTSGTTGRPKRILRTQQAFDQRILFDATSAFADYERALLTTGVNNSMGFTRAYEVLYAGKTACFAPFGQPMLRLVNTYDIDLIVASPQQALGLAELQEKVTHYPLAALKTIRIGGSVMSGDGVQRIKQHLCRNVILTYSSVEAGVVAVAPHEMIENIPNAVGFVIPGAEVQIVDAHNNILRDGAEGFVRVRTALSLTNSGVGDGNAWFYPGDIGWLTADGVLCIPGRKGDVLNRGGVKLSVTDFEDFLRSCPGVTDAGVCTLMGASGFEEVWIGVVLKPAADIGALRKTVEADANFGTNIDKLFIVETIPRGTLGKIQREELKKMLESIAEDTDAPVPRDGAA
jgi:acyl-coenzyme A synthetase/AMP-(fatty) acid ligase